MSPYSTCCYYSIRDPQIHPTSQVPGPLASQVHATSQSFLRDPHQHPPTPNTPQAPCSTSPELTLHGSPACPRPPVGHQGSPFHSKHHFLDGPQPAPDECYTQLSVLPVGRNFPICLQHLWSPGANEGLHHLNNLRCSGGLVPTLGP